MFLVQAADLFVLNGLMEMMRILAGHSSGIRTLRRSLEARYPTQSLVGSHDVVQKKSLSRSYAKPPRVSSFKTIDCADISFFRSVLGTSMQYEGELDKYNEDWLGQLKGESKLILFPKTTEEVSKILKYCNQNKIGVVPQGGNTSLVAGSVPVHDEIVVCLSKMDKIESFNEKTGILKCQSGCILENLDKWVGGKGYLIPLDLAAKGSCQIGGNAATNAGGIHFLRYGSLRANILSMEVVLPDGVVMETNKPLHKDNTGFDLKQLFIGSEGSIGIITKLVIAAHRKPNFKALAALALNSYNDVLELYSKSRKFLGEVISSFEFWDAETTTMTQKRAGSAPLLDRGGSPHNFYVLLEVSSSKKEGEQERFEAFLGNVLDEGIIADAVIAQDLSQQAEFWARREDITEISSREGKCYKYDVSAPIESVYSIVTGTRDHLTSLGFYNRGPDSIVEYILGFGHVGDGNLHLSIVSKSGYDAVIEDSLSPFLYDLISEKNGSVSAEHGLGYNKAPYILYSKHPVAVELMSSIKNIFDPNGIMSPYKFLLPRPYLRKPSKQAAPCSS